MGRLEGAEAIGQAVAGLMAPNPPRGASHHTTHDPLIKVHGDEGSLDVQFIRFDVLGDARPAEGWPAGAIRTQGSVTPTEAGYYRPRLRRVEGQWKIVSHRIVHSLPIVFPKASQTGV